MGIGGRAGMGASSRPRIAVVGSSHWHHKYYRDTLARECDVVAYSDSSPAKLAEGRSWYGDVGHRDWHDLLDESLRLDGVVVLAEHDRMAEVCLAFIERRIPIVLEKPGGLNAAEVGRVRQRADRRGGNRRYQLVSTVLFGPHPAARG
jgi:predicted dehydrogenase